MEQERSDRRGYIEGAHDLWVLSTNPAVAEVIEPVVVEHPSGFRVLVATDGYTRIRGSVRWHRHMGGVGGRG